jgi:hypothetical protein
MSRRASAKSACGDTRLLHSSYCLSPCHFRAPGILAAIPPPKRPVRKQGGFRVKSCGSSDGKSQNSQSERGSQPDSPVCAPSPYTCETVIKVSVLRTDTCLVQRELYTFRTDSALGPRKLNSMLNCTKSPMRGVKLQATGLNPMGYCKSLRLSHFTRPSVGERSVITRP